VAGGGFFCVVGGIGLLRMPDFYTRMHAASVTETLGAGLILLGLMLQAGLHAGGGQAADGRPADLLRQPDRHATRWRARRWCAA
jgi:hypothetical protein